MTTTNEGASQHLVVTALALAIDSGTIDVDDLAASLGAMLPGKPAPKHKGKAVSP